MKVEIGESCFNLVSLYSPVGKLKIKTIKNYCELSQDLLLFGDLNLISQAINCKAKSSNKNGKILEEILSLELDLCVINDETPTYFKFYSDYSEILERD